MFCVALPVAPLLFPRSLNPLFKLRARSVALKLPPGTLLRSFLLVLLLTTLRQETSKLLFWLASLMLAFREPSAERTQD